MAKVDKDDRLIVNRENLPEEPEIATLMDEKKAKRGSMDVQRSEVKWYCRQTMTALGPIIGSIAAGMTTGYSAVLLPQLQPAIGSGSSSNASNETLEGTRDIVVETTDQESWVAASGALLMAPGCWIAGFLIEKFGRRIAHLIVSPIFMAGWIIAGVAPSMTWLIVGRLFCGLCTGIHGPMGAVYIAETCHPRLRGILLAGISLAIAMGILISHALGTWLHWRLTAYLCGLFPIMCFLFCFFAPESPTWLLAKDKLRKAETAWIYLRGQYSMLEFESLKKKQQHEGDTACNGATTNSTVRETTWREAITSPVFVKPLVILSIFFMINQFSGVNAVISYCVQMLKEVSGPENAYTATLILDAIRLGFSVLACWLTRNYSRRLLALASTLGTALTLMSLGTCLFFDIGKPWLSIVILFIYTCVVTIGLVPLPWMLCGELFSASLRGLGSGLTTSINFLCFFLVVKTGPAMFEAIAPQGGFMVYGFVALVGSIFLYFYLPETKDKTLPEIEKAFTNKKDKKTEDAPLPTKESIVV